MGLPGRIFTVLEVEQMVVTDAFEVPNELVIGSTGPAPLSVAAQLEPCKSFRIFAVGQRNRRTYR